MAGARHFILAALSLVAATKTLSVQAAEPSSVEPAVVVTVSHDGVAVLMEPADRDAAKKIYDKISEVPQGKQRDRLLITTEDGMISTTTPDLSGAYVEIADTLSEYSKTYPSDKVKSGEISIGPREKGKENLVITCGITPANPKRAISGFSTPTVICGYPRKGVSPG